MNPEYTPKITVIVPMYNCEDYIEECLESVKRQTLVDFEVVCVDDASTDATMEKAHSCIANDPRFRMVEHGQNSGLSASRNTALDVATGLYVVFLDSDDYLTDDALEKLWNRASSQQLDDLYYSGQSFYETDDLRSMLWEDLDRRTSFEEVLPGKELFTLFEERDEFFPHAALRMVRRSLLDDAGIRFTEGIIHEDILFTFKTLIASKRSSFLSDIVYMRRIRRGSIMSERGRDLRTVEGHFVSIREMKRWMREHAEELDARFIKAMMHRIDVFSRIAGHDWCSFPDKEAKEQYLASLSQTDLVDFYSDIVYPGVNVQEKEDEYLESKTYRLGNALISGPRRIKNKLSKQ